MAEQAEEREVDVLIIGAGLTGLYAAHVYNQLSPGISLIILDNKGSIGGIWAAECLYPGLKTQNPVGTYEYSEYPLDLVKYNLKPGQPIPGETVHRYLTDYAEQLDLVRYIRLNTQVTEIVKLNDGYWRVHAVSVLTTTPDVGAAASESGVEDCYYTTPKLLLCIGLASVPNPISIPGMSSFDNSILSATDLPSRLAPLLSDSAVQTVTVLGGSKTAYDCVASLCAAGKKVVWIIRSSGMGPLWITSPDVDGSIDVASIFGPFGLLFPGCLRSFDPAKLPVIRFFSWFSPCAWGNADGFGWIRWSLNRTRPGRWLMHRFWEGVTNRIIHANGWREENLKGLQPDCGLFWTGRVGVRNYEVDTHDAIRSGQVIVMRKDVQRLEKGKVVMADGAEVRTDTLIAITGWSLRSSIKFSPPDLESQLGIPCPVSTFTEEQMERWKELDARADIDIARRFPYLVEYKPAQEPKRMHAVDELSPFRLYRAIAPTDLTAHGDRSIVFLKQLGTVSNAALTEVQVLWAYAYLQGSSLPNLPLRRHPNRGERDRDCEEKLDNGLNGDSRANRDEMFWQTTLMSRFGRHRTPCGFGAWHPEMNYDAIPYVDLLLSDLRLRSRRKGCLWKEVFEPYGIRDYTGLLGEMRERLPVSVSTS